MKQRGKHIFTIIIFLLAFKAQAQNVFIKIDSFFAPSSRFEPVRFYTGVAAGTVVYAGGTYILYNYWYKDQGLGKFHFFNDCNEWCNMDKIGHVYSAYNQSSIFYEMARWTGLPESKSIWFGIFAGSLMQSTIEVLDGFSPKWGFSVCDIAANTTGLGMFYIQQRYWKEQKILLKVSSYPGAYSGEKIYDSTHRYYTTLEDRADALFGSSFLERYLKDYNAQSYWLSFNLRALSHCEKFPSWLNLAIGYSGENMFGGYANAWIDENGARYDITGQKPRYFQFFISPDIDFKRFKTGSHFLKALLRSFNLVKVPAPALEINSRGEIIFHLFYM